MISPEEAPYPRDNWTPDYLCPHGSKGGRVIPSNLQQVVTEWKVELERKGVIINVRRSKIMDIGRE